MKTNKLLFTLALAGSLAACSNEDIVTQDNLQIKEDGRPVVGKVLLQPSVAGANMDSRFGFDESGNYAFIPGKDPIGAAQMDMYRPSEKPTYLLMDYLRTNYKYNYTEDKVWESDALMTEGNYFFYAPYNAAIRSGKLYHEVNPVQYVRVVDGKLDQKSAIKENQFFLGWQFIDETMGEELPVNFRMSPMHARLGFKLNYIDGSDPVTIKKVVLRRLETEENVKGDTGHNDVQFIGNLGGIAGFNGAFSYAPMFTRVNVIPDQDMLDPLCYNKDIYRLKDGIDYSNAKKEDYSALMASLIRPEGNKETQTYQYELNFEQCAATTLKSGQSVGGYMVVPFRNFAQTTGDWNNMEDIDAIAEPAYMSVQVYTDRGSFEVPLIWDNMDISTTDKNVSVTASTTKMLPDGLNIVTINFNATAASNKPKTFSVGTTNQLEELVSLWEKEKADVTLHLYAQDGVELSQKAYDVLAANQNLKLTLERGTLTIPANLTLKDEISPIELINLNNEYADAAYINRVMLENNAEAVAPVIVVKGDYAVSEVNYTSTSGATVASQLKNILAERYDVVGTSTCFNHALPAIVVAEGGKLNVTGNLLARIVNHGQTTFAENEFVISVANTNVVNIEKGLLAYHVFNDSEAVLNVNGGTNKFALFNDRDLKMKDECCLFEKDWATWKFGLVNIAENAEVYLYGHSWYEEEVYWEGNWGKIVNKGTVKASVPGVDHIESESFDAVYCINHGFIVNEGDWSDLWNEGYVINKGRMNVSKAGVFSYIDVTNSISFIRPVKADNEAATAIYVYNVTADKKSDTFDGTWGINKIVVENATFTLNSSDNHAIKQVVLKDGATITDAADAEGNACDYTDATVISVEGESIVKDTEVGTWNILKGVTGNAKGETEFANVYVLGGKFVIPANTDKMTWTGEIKNVGGEVTNWGEATQAFGATYEGFEWNGNHVVEGEEEETPAVGEDLDVVVNGRLKTQYDELEAAYPGGYNIKKLTIKTTAEINPETSNNTPALLKKLADKAETVVLNGVTIKGLNAETALNVTNLIFKGSVEISSADAEYFVTTENIGFDSVDNLTLKSTLIKVTTTVLGGGSEGILIPENNGLGGVNGQLSNSAMQIHAFDVDSKKYRIAKSGRSWMLL